MRFCLALVLLLAHLIATRGEACSGGSLLTATAGSLSTGGSGRYNSNMQCAWTINSGSTTVILSFVSFDMEAGYDFLRVYDGESRTEMFFSTLSVHEHEIR